MPATARFGGQPHATLDRRGGLDRGRAVGRLRGDCSPEHVVARSAVRTRGCFRPLAEGPRALLFVDRSVARRPPPVHRRASSPFIPSRARFPERALHNLRCSVAVRRWCACFARPLPAGSLADHLPTGRSSLYPVRRRVAATPRPVSTSCCAAVAAARRAPVRPPVGLRLSVASPAHDSWPPAPHPVPIPWPWPSLPTHTVAPAR